MNIWIDLNSTNKYLPHYLFEKTRPCERSICFTLRVSQYLVWNLGLFPSSLQLGGESDQGGWKMLTLASVHLHFWWWINSLLSPITRLWPLRLTVCLDYDEKIYIQEIFWLLDQVYLATLSIYDAITISHFLLGESEAAPILISKM